MSEAGVPSCPWGIQSALITPLLMRLQKECWLIAGWMALELLGKQAALITINLSRGRQCAVNNPDEELGLGCGPTVARWVQGTYPPSPRLSFPTYIQMLMTMLTTQ